MSCTRHLWHRAFAKSNAALAHRRLPVSFYMNPETKLWLTGQTKQHSFFTKGTKMVRLVSRPNDNYSKKGFK
jgi:hypothetical protein